MSETQKVGRLAFREEGIMWNAYYAELDTMAGAVLIGSIAMAGIDGRPERKRAFMDVMRDVVGDIIHEKTGQRPKWGEQQTAPEHERGRRN